MAKSFKGKEVDMGALQMANQEAVALGNAKMNARGDILGQGGKVVKTREQIAKEHYNQNVANVVETNEPMAMAKPKDLSLDEFTGESGAIEAPKPKRRRVKKDDE